MVPWLIRFTCHTWWLVIVFAGCDNAPDTYIIIVSKEKGQATVRFDGPNDIEVDKAAGKAKITFPSHMATITETHQDKRFVGLLLEGKKGKSIKVVAHLDEALDEFDVIVDTTVPVLLKGRMEESDSAAKVATELVPAGRHTLRLRPEI